MCSLNRIQQVRSDMINFGNFGLGRTGFDTRRSLNTEVKLVFCVVRFVIKQHPACKHTNPRMQMDLCNQDEYTSSQEIL
jgi:hypothetical protein